MSQSFALAARLRRELRAPDPLAGAISGPRLFVNGARDAVRVSGWLNLSHGSIVTKQECHLSATVPLAPFRSMPSVRYRAHWHPPPGDIGWHVNSDGSLCWEIGDCWRDVLAALEAKLTEDARIGYAAAWCLNSVRWLIYHHLAAWREGRTEWPADWPQWAHGLEGVEQYRRELSARRDDPLRMLRPPLALRSPANSQP